MSDLLGFINLSYFKENDKQIKQFYQELSISEKWDCKRKFYKNPFLTEAQKDGIWEWFHNDITRSEMRKKLANYYFAVIEQWSK